MNVIRWIRQWRDRRPARRDVVNYAACGDWERAHLAAKRNGDSDLIRWMGLARAMQMITEIEDERWSDD